MIGLGTIANTLAVIIGSGIGLMIKSGLKPRYQETIMQALGLSTLFIGVSGAMSGMLKIIDNGIETQGSMLLIGSLVFGALLGEFLNIELRLEQAGEWLKKKVHIKNDNTFVEGFVTATLVICVGAMAVVGALQDGLQGDVSTLFAKSVLDFVIVMVFASTLGVGVTFSALPLLIYQGSITLFASFLKSFLSPIVIANLSFIGSVLIFAVGINLCFNKKIKIANLLPAMIIPFLFH
ncbi:MAG: DUF554 domain-containing protein [Coprobacillus sp.]|jgi:uncharacterized membrane protein YqgA involved in biofilm formation|nr:DUF554 domain-containing protein [Coprobacillus sp.]